METVLFEILENLRTSKAHAAQDAKMLDHVLNRVNRGVTNNAQHISKRALVSFYRTVKSNSPEQWETWNIDEALEQRLLTLLKLKPRRTTSGVATITVITAPYACGNDCAFCPKDVRMPKSYLHDEPACMRAESCFFDPYIQVENRLRNLEMMGHTTDKIELIVLGGTWSDYPKDYQNWFIAELLRALNDKDAQENAHARREEYEQASVPSKPEACEQYSRETQKQVNANELTFASAIKKLYGAESVWGEVSSSWHATIEEVEYEQQRNETSVHRVVGLVVETRPDRIDAHELTRLRRLGCTKIQMGVQSLDDSILRANNRGTTVAKIRDAFALLRLFGFKTHAHMMVNLMGATPESDMAEYDRFVSDPAFMPDEIKLYPCVLLDSAPLVKHFAEATWVPYEPSILVSVLKTDILATPAWTRISRMIRDFSAPSIAAGNKVANLRQLVEESFTKEEAALVNEIRFREINRKQTSIDALELKVHEYQTSVSREYFLEWVTLDNQIAGFLRLSLPSPAAFRAYKGLPTTPNEAMIREVHVYGAVACLGGNDQGVQHRGLGRALIERACEIAREAGYTHINVISAIGTREYYRMLNFKDAGLYQKRAL